MRIFWPEDLASVHPDRSSLPISIPHGNSVKIFLISKMYIFDYLDDYKPAGITGENMTTKT